MLVLVDAFNVLHVTGVLPPDLAGPNVVGLGRLIADSRYGRARVILVCDGIGPDNTADSLPGSVEVRFAGVRRDADTAIEDLIQSAGGGGGRKLLIVSSDHRLERAARRARARWLPSDVFLRQLAYDHERRAASATSRQPGGRPAFTAALPLDPAERREWLRYFGIGPDDDLARLPASEVPSPLPPLQPPPPDAAAPPLTSLGPTLADDPLIREALKEWRGRLSLDDLDMSRWLTDTPPPPRP